MRKSEVYSHHFVTLLETALFSDITCKYFEVYQLANFQYILYAVS